MSPQPVLLDTLNFSDAFLDFAQLAEWTVITDGKERMRLYDPFDNRIIPLDHVQPSGSAVFAQSAGSIEPGEYYYSVTQISQSQHREIESPALQLGLVTIAAGSNQDVLIDLRGITRLWSEATHLVVYRSLKAVQAGDNDPFPTHARVGTVAVGDLTISPFVAFTDNTPDDDLDFANAALNIFVGPPPIAPYIAQFKNRMFATGFEAISETGALVTLGSPNVDIPIGFLDRLHVGSTIQFGTDERAYLVLDMIPAEDRRDEAIPPFSPPSFDRIILGNERDEQVNYAGSTGTKDFLVCFDPTEVRFSEPGKPWDWPPINRFNVGQGHGRNTMIGASRNTLIVGKRVETWGFLFNQYPGRGNDFQISAKIGCVSQRTFDLDENGKARWLATHGIAEFNGQQLGIISEGIAGEFRRIEFEADRGQLALRAVAAHDIERHQYICAVPTSKADKGVGSRELFVYHYNTRAWAIFETQIEITDLVQDRDASGYPAVHVGTRLGYVGTLGIGVTDFVGTPGNIGDVKGTIDTYVASPTPKITDDDATFFDDVASPRLGVRGAAIEITGGAGAGQLNRIVDEEVSPRTLILEEKFATRLDSTSQYRLGAIACDHRSPWLDFGTNKLKRLRRIQIAYYIEPISPSGDWTLEIFFDQAGVVTPVIAQSGGQDAAETTNPVRFTFKADGSDEDAGSGRASQSPIGLTTFNPGGHSFVRMQYRLFSEDPNTPGTIISVTPILQQDALDAEA